LESFATTRTTIFVGIFSADKGGDVNRKIREVETKNSSTNLEIVFVCLLTFWLSPMAFSFLPSAFSLLPFASYL
jgi:hypothetical protein